MDEQDALKKEKEIDAIAERESGNRLRERIKALRASKAAKENISKSAVLAEVNSEPQVVPPLPVEPEVEVVIPEVVDAIPKPKESAKADARSEIKEPAIDVEFQDLEGEKREAEAREWARELRVEDAEPEIRVTEKDARLMELSRRLDEARKDFVKQDREMDKGASVWKKITGIFKRLDTGTLKEAFDEARVRYEGALKEYRDAILELEADDKEDAKIVTEWITKGEFLRLESERLDAKSREENGWLDKVKNGYLGMVEKYRKLSTAQKIAIGLGISATGFGIGLTGGTLLAGGLLTSRQIFSMSVSAVGFKGMFEAIAEKKRKKEASQEVEAVLREATVEEKGVSVEMLIRILDQKIGGLNDRIQKEKKNKKYRTWLAVGTGVAFSYIARYVGKEALEHSGARDVLKGAGEKVAEAVGNQQGVVGVGHNPESASGVVKDDSTISEKVVENLNKDNSKVEVPAATEESSTSLKVAKGSSLEGTIIKHLRGQGMSLEEAGKKAHLMALEFLGNQSATEHHLIHPDARINLDASGNIESVDDLGSRIEAATETSNEAPAEVSAESVEARPDSVVLTEQEIGNSELQTINDVISQRSFETVSSYSGNILQERALNSDARFIKSIKDYVFGNDFGLWSAERDVPMKNILADKSASSAHEKIFKLFNHMIKMKNPNGISEINFGIFKDQIKPKGDESLFKWMVRVAKLTREYKISKL